MIKTLLFFLLLLIFGILAHLYLPWWSIAGAAALAGVWTGFSAGRNFLLGFLGVFLLWGGYAYWLHQANAGRLGDMAGQLFGGVDGLLLVLATAVLGGILGGLGAMTGGMGRRALE